MKTSVIEVRDMLSVLSVDGVEKRIGEVPGVESVTVNFAAKSATVRYDETRLEVGDIKSDVRQRGYESAPEPPPEPASHDKPASAASEQATPQAPLKVTSPPVAEAPKADPVAAPEAAAAAPAAVPPPTPPAAGGAEDSAGPGAIEKVKAWVRDTFAGDDTGPEKSDTSSSSGAAEALYLFREWCSESAKQFAMMRTSAAKLSCKRLPSPRYCNHWKTFWQSSDQLQRYSDWFAKPS